MNKEQFLVSKGCSDIKHYTLISNYGFTFCLNGINYDIRFWENCYGCYVGKWSVHVVNGVRDFTETQKATHESNKPILKEIENFFNKPNGEED